MDAPQISTKVNGSIANGVENVFLESPEGRQPSRKHAETLQIAAKASASTANGSESERKHAEALHIAAKESGSNANS